MLNVEEAVTLSARNNFFKVCIIFTSLSLCLAAAGGYFAFPAFPEAAETANLRSQGIMQAVAVKLAEPSAFVPFWIILGLVTYSLISTVLIYHFFENTQSSEILFFAFFIISLSFEFLRVLLPLRGVFDFSATYLIAASRVLFFGRHFGQFSLFVAGAYAAGLDTQRQRHRGVFLMLTVASLYIAANVPVDGLVWDSTFVLQSGYSAMFRMTGAGILIITVITFFISAYTRGSKNYIFIGIGILFAYIGRNILFSSDSWITPLPGLFFLGLGTWFTCTRLHRQYLWL